MKQHLQKRFNDRREGLIYVVLALWTLLGTLSLLYGTDLEHTAVYFTSLTGFIGSYIWGESVRKSDGTSIFLKGKNSSREILIYITTILWTALGVWGILTGSDMLSASAYFAALTPFVGAYMLGETYKPVDPASLRPKVANDPLYRSAGITTQPATPTDPAAPNAPNANYNPQQDQDVQKIQQDKQKDPTLPEPDIQNNDTSA